MALAYGNFHELSHQLRFLLFEIGIGLPQNSIDYFITLAHKNSLKRLQHAALLEGLINNPIASHHVHDFIDQLQMKLKKSAPESQFYQWNNIRNELDESIANEALAQAYKQCWQAQLQNETASYDSLWSWINDKKNANQSLLFMEQWGSPGHHYHPTFRAKMGFTRREVLQNSPEFQAKISVHWCALHKAKARITDQSVDFDAYIAQEFPKEYLLWQEKLIFNHLNPHDYYPVPIHPWQWRNRLQMMCAPMIDNKELTLLPHHQALMPSMSCDNVMSLGNSNSVIKLAMSINTPYARRNDATEYGSEISRWVNSLLIKTGHYQDSLFIASEQTGLIVNDDSIPEYCKHELSVGLYQNPISLIKPDQKAVPLASLFSLSPLTHTPIIIEIIKASCMSPIAYFSQYCHKILFSQLHLLLKYGVAFAAQPHNTLVVFADNKPQGLIIRNLEHLKICDHPFFKDNGMPDLPAASNTKESDLNLLRTLFTYATIQNNIGSWINVLHHEYHIPVQQLWSTVNEVLQLIFKELSTDIHPRILSWQKHLLLHDAWQHPCLFKMRLSSNPNKDIYVKQSNLLSDL